jgi:predicted phage terminase large subunit-like protein
MTRSFETPETVDTLCRHMLLAFLVKVFETLHPSGPALAPNWHIEAMCRLLEKVDNGDTTRLIMEVPPRHLKSILTSVAFTAWLLGRNPGIKIIVASYAGELAEKHARDLRLVMNSDWYKALFPDTRIKSDTANEITTTEGGGRRAVSLGGTVTGLGADLIIIDDLMKAADASSDAETRRVHDFYTSTLLSRLNDQRSGKIVVIQQRLAEYDLVGFLKENARFEVASFPSIAQIDETFDLGRGEHHHRKRGDILFPALQPEETLSQIRREIGNAAFAAQYLQNPAAPEGNRIRMDWFGTYKELPQRNRFTSLVLSVDTGASELPTSDFSVCTVWGFHNDNWYLADLMRGRFTYPRLKDRIIGLIEHWKADRVLVEKMVSGHALFDDLFYTHNYRGKIVRIIPDLPKEIRVEQATAELETGKFFLPSEAMWLTDFERECRAFPAGRHDDQVDSLSQFVNWQKGPRVKSILNRKPGGNVPSRHLSLKQRIHDHYRNLYE